MFIVHCIFSTQAFLYQYFDVFLVNNLYIKAKKTQLLEEKYIGEYIFAYAVTKGIEGA